MRGRISPQILALLACSAWLCGAYINPKYTGPDVRVRFPAGTTPADPNEPLPGVARPSVPHRPPTPENNCGLSDRESALATLNKAAKPAGRVSEAEASSARAALFARINCLSELRFPPDSEAQKLLCRAWALELNPPDFHVPQRLCAAYPAVLGRLAELGEKNLPRALKFYEAAAAEQDHWAMTRLGVFYANGMLGQPDYAKAAKLFGDAKHNTPATTQLALMYERGLGLQQNSKKAAYWYAKAVDREDPAAAGRLALLYARGDGVPKDMRKAKELFRQARNSKTAAYGAAMLLCSGPDNCPPQAEEALRAAAARGYETDFWRDPVPDTGLVVYHPVKMLTPGLPEAQYALAQYELSLSSNVAAAQALHEEAAAQGFGPSYARLAALYYEDGSPQKLGKACTALSVIAQDRTAGPPPETPGLSSYCNYLLLSAEGAQAQKESALPQLQAAAAACAAGACPPAFRELVSARINAITEARQSEQERLKALGAPPAPPGVKLGYHALLLIAAALCGILALWVLVSARRTYSDKTRRQNAETALSALKNTFLEMKRDGIEPPRRPPENCGPEEDRLWKQAAAGAADYFLAGGGPGAFSTAELRLLFHCGAADFLRWACGLNGAPALALARALSDDGHHGAAAELISPRVFASLGTDAAACEQALALLKRAGTLTDFTQAQLSPGAAPPAFYRPFAGALLRAGLPRHAYQAYCLAPSNQLDKNDAWEFFRLCMAENDLFRAAKLLEKVQCSPENEDALRAAAARAVERGHTALARRIHLLLGAPQP